jgi:hypothetical protein
VCILMGSHYCIQLFCCCISMIRIIQDNPFPEISVYLGLFITGYMIHLHIRSMNTSLLTIRQSKNGFKNQNNYIKRCDIWQWTFWKALLIRYWLKDPLHFTIPSNDSSTVNMRIKRMKNWCHLVFFNIRYTPFT